MGWFVERFNTVFAGYAPFDMFGCGLVLSVCIWLTVLSCKIGAKVIDKFLDLIFDWIDRRRKADTAE